ncbi:hypothetical protein [Demequina litorisediminis]|uniref:Uncharacterized protein n=1 Tax=Demequina litorisediminis TaxID=1849022 RepID=A0ABQ6I8X2_9MICO|nr:hypothetical protein [Demequina litorisediminis]GMA34225.1 hypothetical protein GCM10025876_04290 [Demequina litorisediminis]
MGAARGRRLDPTRDLGISPWQADRARRELQRWTADSLAQAIEAVATADAEIKGASRAPQFALERAVRTVAQARPALVGKRRRACHRRGAPRHRACEKPRRTV